MNKKVLPARPEIKFIDYTGKYPSLCFGHLIIEFNGERMDLGSILISHGSIHNPDTGDYEAMEGDWDISEESLPEKLRPFCEDIVRLVNDNVEHGCCGGCI